MGWIGGSGDGMHRYHHYLSGDDNDSDMMIVMDGDRDVEGK